MSRLSRANLKSRESVFAGGPELYRGDIQAICPPNLEECVMAMEDCCEEAYEAQQLLRNGTYDLPRMTKILGSQRVTITLPDRTVVEFARVKSSSTAGILGPQKLEVRRLHMLTKQRQRLEEEVEALESEIQAMELEMLK
ncbi:hypothetical protein J132_10401 [Termitomyces sp. J132]|nr:hypothetical protein J132_10401 [Termitomyces sp. J132]